jgi:hypothetical protein
MAAATVAFPWQNPFWRLKALKSDEAWGPSFLILLSLYILEKLLSFMASMAQENQR